jgi:hypothetical protein
MTEQRWFHGRSKMAESFGIASHESVRCRAHGGGREAPPFTDSYQRLRGKIRLQRNLLRRRKGHVHQ